MSKFQQIKPQKARGVLTESMWYDPAWVAEEKYDGDRRIAQFCGLTGVRFTGTRESVDGTGFVEKSDNLPQMSGVCSQDLIGTILDGEIIAPFADKLPGGKSKYVTSIMGSAPAVALQKQREHGWLEYVVFDCLAFKGRSCVSATLQERRAEALKALSIWGSKYASIANQVADGKRAYYERIIKRGGEGVILKHRLHTYGNEKLWVKVKGEWTADVIVHSFTEGKGKYKGQIGAIVFSQYRKGVKDMPVIIGQCSGIDDVLRKDLTENTKRYSKRVFRIKHNGREPTGAFRHPRFDCWRDDKSPKDCVYDPNES